MKKILFALLLLISQKGFTQSPPNADWNKDKIDLHMSEYKDEMREAKAFILTGFFIGVGGGILLSARGNDKDGFTNAIAMIGTTFSGYGLVKLFNSGRHIKKVENLGGHWMAEK